METTGKKHIKTLDTLVPDINKLLTNLGDGKKLEVSDEQLNKFVQNIKDALVDWANPVKQDKSSLRMSILGRPLRQLWYDKHKPIKREKSNPSLQLKFLYGHLLEVLVLFFVKLSGHKLDSQQKEVTVSGIKGHMDCKIDGEGVDIKTASSFAFKKFLEGTLHDDDPFGYMAQLSGYETAEGTNEGGFLAMNKESGELALYQPGPLVKINIKDKIKSIRSAADLDKPPARCYNTIPEAKRGNMRLPRQCVYCPYKMECHSDANNGYGLRLFKYSNGIKYFTRVVSMPKVLELTPRER